jgi:hypothetical protein
MVSVLHSSVLGRGFYLRSGQTKDNNIDICRFSANHAALRNMNKECLVRNHNDVSLWSDMSTHGLLVSSELVL